MVWQDTRNLATTGFDVFGARVAKTGALLDAAGIPISTGPDHEGGPDVAFNGVFLVLWNDRRSGASIDVFGTRVRADGSVVDVAGFPLATGATDEIVRSVTIAPGDDWGLVYDRFAPEPPYGATRAFLRTVSPK